METVSSREVYRNAWMRVREDEVRRPDGSTGVFGVVDQADELRHLGHLHQAYGFCSQGFDVYLATGLRTGPPRRESSERDMQHRRVPEQEFRATGQVALTSRNGPDPSGGDRGRCDGGRVRPAPPRRVPLTRSRVAGRAGRRRQRTLSCTAWPHQEPPRPRAGGSLPGPDEPYGDLTQEDMAAGHWALLQQIVQRHGGTADAVELSRLPHDVVLSPGLLARLSVGPRAGSDRRQPGGSG